MTPWEFDKFNNFCFKIVDPFFVLLFYHHLYIQIFWIKYCLTSPKLLTTVQTILQWYFEYIKTQNNHLKLLTNIHFSFEESGKWITHPTENIVRLINTHIRNYDVHYYLKFSSSILVYYYKYSKLMFTSLLK